MKHYDKIFFLVALIILGVGVGIFVANKPSIQKTQRNVKERLAQKANGIVWKEVKVPELKIATIEWPEIVAQDEDGKWFFQVFTPPQIWVDNDGKFITESPYIKEVARQSFALKYKGVSNEPYPIRYIGHSGVADNPTISLYNEKTKMYFNGRLNQEIVVPEPSTGKNLNLGLTIKSFKVERVDSKDKNKTLSKRRVDLTLFDKAMNRTLAIHSDKPTILEDQRRMTFVLNNGTEWHVKSAPAELEVEKGKYRVESIDFANESAVIELIPDDKKAEVQKMNVSAAGVTSVDTKKNKK